jgi:iron complex outermembrane receptor protein
MRGIKFNVGKRALLLAGSGLAMAVSSAPALAQDAANADVSAAAETAVEQNSGGLDVIVVTARKREEDAQETPIAPDRNYRDER